MNEPTNDGELSDPDSLSHGLDRGDLTTPAEGTPANAQQQAGGPLPQFFTALSPLEQQVGLHVIGALQHPNTIAVLTTVSAGGDGRQQLVSIGLDSDRLGQIQKLLAGAKANQKRRVQCVGFHCHFVDDDVDRKPGSKEDGSQS